MDYIDKYLKASSNGFASDEDKKAKAEFWEKVPVDVEWAKKNNLITPMSMEDYIQRGHTKLTESIRSVILHEARIPAQILATYYDISLTHIYRMRRDHEKKGDDQ